MYTTPGPCFTAQSRFKWDVERSQVPSRIVRRWAASFRKKDIHAGAHAGAGAGFVVDNVWVYFPAANEMNPYPRQHAARTACRTRMLFLGRSVGRKLASW
jgi:hypothetical protein